MQISNVSEGSLLGLCDLFRRKGAPDDRLMAALAGQTTRFVTRLSYYYTENSPVAPHNASVSADLRVALGRMCTLAGLMGWKRLVLPVDPHPDNVHFQWVKDHVLCGLDTEGVAVGFQKKPYIGPKLGNDEAVGARSVFDEGVRGLVHLAKPYRFCDRRYVVN